MTYWWQRSLVLLGGVLAAGWLGWRYRQLLRVWRGERLSWVPSHALFAVFHRSYLTYTLTATGYLGGTAGVAIGLALDVVPVAWTGLLLWLATVPLLLVHLVVNAFNRPAMLVPPRYRHQKGTISEGRQARARKRADLPPTEHLVVINEVRSPQPADFDPFLVAICTAEACDWMEFADREGVSITAEHELRQKCARHTSNVAEQREHPLA